MKIVSVKPLPEFKLQATFDDGVCGVVDLKEFVKYGIFSVLQAEDSFNKVYTNGYAIAWNDDLEIDSLTIYAEILNMEPADILSQI
ncbi:MAG: DUF2442 domain-containing protein [Bacteroidota bacterium]|nr:DUF2442 domain-containing protein [Bacteroidota bacterium]